MNVEIANRLMELRKQNGYSQEELADKIGVSRQAISKWERAAASPDTSNLILLARTYGITLDELINTTASSEDLKAEENENRENKEAEENTNANSPTKKSRNGILLISLAGITTFIVTIVYIILGETMGVEGWGKGWLVFFLIPIMGSVSGAITTKKMTSFAYPLVAVLIYMAIGLLGEIWHPTWLIFITIPLYYMIADVVDRARGL